MTTPAAASLLRAALVPEALTRARRRLLTAHPDPTSSKTPASGSPTDDQLRVLAASDWVPPRIGALDTNAIATADTVTRALLAESVREILERRLTAERPHGTYDDTRAGHDAFSTTVTDDYDHGNHHLARAILRPAASLIGAKIRGQIHVLTRIARRDEAVHVADTTAHMHAWRRSLAVARTLDEVMGIEGACSNAYFDALAGCVPADVTFDGRSRRPPRDLPNAALSYGYAILLSECVGALHAAGPEPSLGIAHAPTDKRPSLALDLMEQFRPLLVDQTVMALLRTRTLRPEHGAIEAEAGGVWLGGDGKKILVDAYEAACQRSVTGALPGYSGSWRRHITHSAQMLARAITEPDYQWNGGAWR